MTRPINMRTLKQILLISGLLIGLTSVVYAGITGSKHDFSGKGWGSNEICVFCHTPHNAKKDGVTTIYPLWNHTMSTSTYTLYSSPTLDSRYPPQQPRGPSKLCLSCHDGTVAIDSFGTQTGTHLIDGLANLGTNLSNDHPISIYWGHQTYTGGNASCVGCHQIRGGGRMSYIGLPFYERYLECATCHEPHNKIPSNGKMLRKPLIGSEICQHCHGK